MEMFIFLNISDKSVAFIAKIFEVESLLTLIKANLFLACFKLLKLKIIATFVWYWRGKVYK